MIFSRRIIPDAPVPKTGTKPLPASAAQEQLWALAERRPDQPIGNFPVALSIEGHLDAGLLARALNDVIARHDILRTSFEFTGGRPAQVVAPVLNVPVPVVDLRLLPEGVREAQAFRLAREDAARPFDVRKLPLLRAQLFLFEQTRQILVLTLHRGIFEQDSLGILLRELAACYEARRMGGTPALPPLPIQYATYAARSTGQTVVESPDTWWSAKFSGEPVQLQLPADRIRSGGRAGGSRVEKLELPAALRSSVETLAQREGTNHYTILLTAFQVLLHRYTNQTDFVMGMIVSDRHTPETENLIGPFARVVPYRADLSGDLSFRRLLERVRQEVLDIFAHSSRAPFAGLPGRFSNPAFSCPVQFSLERREAELTGWPGLRLQELELDSGASPCELAFHLIESAAGLGVRAEYDADLFSPAVIQRLLAHFGVLLHAAVSRPAGRLSELPLLTPVERRRLLSEWNNSVLAYPRDATAHELVSHRAAVEPSAVAVASAAGNLTYLELDQRSNQLGRHLRAAGVRPGQLVGLCVDRSPQLIVGVLGILKAGGAVLPLDPSLPEPARTHLLKDARPNLFLTNSPLRHAFAPESNRVLLLDAEAIDIQREDEAVLAPLAAPDDFAWLVSTAGTGGQSRPVELSHRAIVSTLYALRRLSGISNTDVVLAAAPLLSADAMTGLLLPLVFGARLELAAGDDIADPAHLVAHASACHPTLMLAAPSEWRQLLDAGWHGEKSLRILASGEPLTRELADRLLRYCRELWNLYGSAETTGACLAAPVLPGRQVPVIGRPLGNVQVHVLDAHLQPVPVGIMGEIYVGGDTLATGYRGQPTETATHFPADPFRRTPGARLFRTGDLARRLINGEIEFLHRHDARTPSRHVAVPTEPAPETHAAEPEPEAPAPVHRERSPVSLSFPAITALPSAL
jgi:amino acid adenylation domain-containing protein